MGVPSAAHSESGGSAGGQDLGISTHGVRSLQGLVLADNNLNAIEFETDEVDVESPTHEAEVEVIGCCTARSA